MSVFKCKMCGGTIDFEQGSTIGVCDHCGTKQTLPRLDNDRKTNLYDRANHFRRNNDFDKAMGIYEQILNEDNTDAEAYWSIVLCRYGIEYVEDPSTHRRVPTINRTQFTSVFSDEDYKSAISYADTYQKSIYEEEAKAIDEIQKGILSIAQKEEPFDVFICYKETDANGRRTPDSVLANDLYHQLTQEGFKVFFSRITLEDKLGIAYEPYIFAALNSSKVMVVLGTKPEYFNAVWVKNEWSRYLTLIKNGAKKTLIPAYRDMDPYDLPEEFSHLQAQDMSKLGFMQDLIRGIKKITSANEPKVTEKEPVFAGSTVNVAPLLKRVFMFLEDGEWNRADDFCEQILNQEPENAQAYLGKLMAELHVRHMEDLPNCELPFDNSNNYKKIIRFGDDKIAGTLSGYINQINKRNENMRLTGIYNNAVAVMKSAVSESLYVSAAETFKTISGFMDADSLAEQCLDKAEDCRKDTVYATAISQMRGHAVGNYEAAIKMFSTISGWKRAAREEARKKTRGYQIRRLARILIPFLIIAAGAAAVWFINDAREQSYSDAAALYEAGDYAGAAAAFDKLGSYKDAADQASRAKTADAIQTNYIRAGRLLDNGRYDDARELYLSLGDYQDSAQLAVEAEYRKGLELVESGAYAEARALFEQLGDYKDAAEISAHFFDRLLSEELSYAEAVSGPLTTVYTYDSQGRLATATEQLSAYDKEDRVSVYTWKDDGSYDVTEGQTVRHYDSNGSLLGQGEQTLYTYDYGFFDNGVLHYCETYDAVTGDYLGGVVNDEHGNTLRITDKSGGTKKVTSEYKGEKLVKQETYTADGTMLDRTSFEYDSEGRVKRSSYVTPGASSAITRSYTYGLVYVPEAVS